MAWAQVKKKPYADYDLRPRPMAWAQVKNPTQIMTCAPAYGLGTSKKKKKKPYADYDLRPRPMAWAQVTRPCARVDLRPGGFSCCIKLDGLSNLKYC